MEGAILSALFEAKSGRAVKAVIDKYLNDSQFSWRLVGDRDNNYGTISIASDALISLVERITNCIDATFENYVLKDEKWKTLRSPREFAEKVIGFKGSKISAKIKTRIPEPQDNSGIRVEVQSGDKEDVSTIDVLDNGIGLSRNEIPDTILSLNNSNKILKWYLMGRYGQGGSTSLKFSEYTIIITKKHDSDEIAFTIVRYEPPKQDEKDGKYTYVVKSCDRLPLSASASDTSIFLECNTLVRNINYNIGKQSTPLLSLYGKLDYRLFDTVLPFQFVLKKTNGTETRRTMYGSRDRLNRTELVVQKNEIVVPIEEFGRIIIRYWVFGKDVSRQQKLTFIDPEKPIVISFYGQTHSVLPRRILADCKLPYLRESLVVQVECDSLNAEGRHKVITSTREALTSEGEELIKDKIIKTLSTLNELKNLNKEREESYESKYYTEDLEDMKRKLAEMIKRFSVGNIKIQGGSASDGDRKPGKKPDDENDEEDIDGVDEYDTQEPTILVSRDPPTFIRIRNRSNPLLFRENKMTRVDIETDAPDYYLQKTNKDFILSEETKKYVSISHKQTDILNGGIFLYLRLKDGITPSTRFEFRVTLPINGTNVLVDGRPALVKKPILKLPGVGSIQANSPDIQPIGKQHPYYIEKQWDENMVAEVLQGSEKITIYVSVENKWLREILLRGNYSEVKRKAIENRYILLMAFNAYLADKFWEQREKENFELAGNHIQEIFEAGTRTILTAITSEKALESQYDN